MSLQGLTAQPMLQEAVAAERPAHRLERLQTWLENQDLDCFVATGPDNVNYLAGYWRYYGGPSALVVDRGGERTLVVMRDEVPIAERLGEADSVLGYGVRGFGMELNPLPLLADVLASIPSVAAAARVGVGDGLGSMSALLSQRLSAELVSGDSELVRLRLLKDEDELAKVLHAYELCWLAQVAISEALGEGVTEIELFSAAQLRAQVAHGEPIEFLADVLAGSNTADVCCPISIAGRQALAQGEPVVADVVVRANGYWGDTAETHVLGSNGEVEAARAELLEILAKAGSELRPGATGAAVFRETERRILDTFPGGEFPHHLGHALAVTSFEDPHLIPTDEMPLESWMLIAIEPGVYFPGRFGARVENVFVVTSAGGVELREAMGRA